MNLETALQTFARKAVRTGENYIMICCPFHKNGQERHPSMYINLKTKRFSCFACKAKGTAEELLTILAGYPITLDEPDELIGIDEFLKIEQENHAHALPYEILGFFNYRPYLLLQAGFSPEILDMFIIGLDHRNATITFPIIDRDGTLRAVYGRTLLMNAKPKYKAYTKWDFPEDTIPSDYKPQPKKYLFGEHLINPKVETVILVEGFKAAMRVKQYAPHLNVLATMGVNVTQTQLEKVQNWFERAIIMFDADDAGKEMSARLEALLSTSILAINVDISKFNATQPDDLTLEAFQEILRKEVMYDQLLRLI